jgi:hypothetical protein
MGSTLKKTQIVCHRRARQGGALRFRITTS